MRRIGCAETKKERKSERERERRTLGLRTPLGAAFPPGGGYACSRGRERERERDVAILAQETSGSSPSPSSRGQPVKRGCNRVRRGAA